MTHDAAPAQDQDQDSIAIIGMAARMPGAADLDEFWRNLRDGVDSITSFTQAELLEAGLELEAIRRPGFIATKGFLSGTDLFDAGFFGISPREAALIDPQHRLMMECAWEAMEHAGYDAGTFDGRVAIYTSAGMNTYLPLNIMSNPGLAESVGGFQLSIFNDKDFIPTRIAYAMNSTGPGVDIGTACSSSLVGVHVACQALLTYQSDMALVGGVTVHLPQVAGHVHEPGSAYSPDGRCRPFDATVSGLVDGNGVAAVILKRLADAIADGDTIHGVIRGTAINNDGSRKLGYTAPSIEGQAAVIMEAHAVAGCPPETISYVEAHGTATPLGDPVEVAALTRAFRAGTALTGFCGLGAVKSNIGHVDKAAGLAGMIKTVLALKHEAIPPTLNFQAPNPRLNLPETPFHVIDRLLPWPRRAGAPRRAGVSSFGVGGTNAHAVLEEAPPQQAGSPSRPVQIVTLSARSDAALQAAADNLARYLETTPDIDLADVCHTLQRGRRPFAHRRAFAVTSATDAVRRLRAMQPAAACERTDQGVAFLFPGHGSQYPGMARDLYQREPLFRDEIDTCARHLQAELGLDIRTLLFPATTSADAAGKLAQTTFAAPALFCVEYALGRLLMGWGMAPQAMIGHSLGEYAAACLAGVFSLPDALSLVTARARLVEETAPGTMLTVPLTEQAVRSRLGDQLDLAGINAPDMCTVSGPEAAVSALRAQLEAEGLVCTRVRNPRAAHSRYMDPVLEPFRALLARTRMNPPRIPYLSNVTGTWITAEQATSPDYWVAHLRQPVRFADGIARLLEGGMLPLLEVGPGKALSTLVARNGATSCHQTLPQAREERGAQEILLQGVAELWAQGATVDWQAFYRDEKRRRVPLPAYPFQRQSYWTASGRRMATIPDTKATGKRADIADWFHLPGWCPSVAPRLDVDRTDPCLLFADETGLGEALAGELARLGRPVIMVRPGMSFTADGPDGFRLNPALPDDFSALCDTLMAQGRLPRRIVHLWGRTGGNGVPAGRPDIGRHAGSILSLMQALNWLALEEKLELTIVADRMRDVGGETAVDPAKAALLGLAATIPWENPGMVCRVIDVPADAQAHCLAAKLTAELDARAGEKVIALRGGRRWVHALSPVRLEEGRESPSPFRAGGVYVVTGGFGGIGLCLARRIGAMAPVRLALIDTGEAGEPSDDLLTVRVPSYDAASLEAALVRIEDRLGPVDGILHAADMDDARPARLIADLDAGTRERYWHRQEETMMALAASLQNRPAAFCMVMSSLAAEIGAMSQAAHAVAATVLDSFAEKQGWTIIDWDNWTDGDAADAGLAMTAAEGADAFERIVRLASGNRVLVATADMPARLQALRTRQDGKAGSDGEAVAIPAGTGHQRPDLVPYVPPRNEQEAAVAVLWQEILGIDRIGIDDNFFDLGGHSLIAAQLVSRLRRVLQVEMEVDTIFAAPTIARLSETLGAGQPTAATAQDLATLLDRLDTLSDAEVEALLASGELPADLLTGADIR